MDMQNFEPLFKNIFAKKVSLVFFYLKICFYLCAVGLAANIISIANE